MKVQGVYKSRGTSKWENVEKIQNISRNTLWGKVYQLKITYTTDAVSKKFKKFVCNAATLTVSKDELFHYFQTNGITVTELR